MAVSIFENLREFFLHFFLNENSGKNLATAITKGTSTCYLDMDIWGMGFLKASASYISIFFMYFCVQWGMRVSKNRIFWMSPLLYWIVHLDCIITIE